MSFIRKSTVFIIMVCLTLGSVGQISAAQAISNKSEIIGQTSAAVEKTLYYLIQKTPDPTIGSIGGDWLIMGGARSEAGIPSAYLERYYDNAVSYLQTMNGRLSDRKYTEYARAALAMMAIGKNPRDISGYDILKPLEDYEKTIFQGFNGAVYGLLALDCEGDDVTSNSHTETQAIRDLYVAYILEKQLEDGGFSLSATTSDPDVTAMALQALAKYMERPAVNAAVERAVNYLSKHQNEQGGFTAWDETNSESVSQVITALCELGIDPLDSRFIKNGNSLIDNLMGYRTLDGGFKHSADDVTAAQMATEQALYALVSYERYLKDESSLYRMQVISQEVTSLDGIAVNEMVDRILRTIVTQFTF